MSKKGSKHTAFELRMGDKDTRVDDIRASPLARTAVIDIGGVARLSMRNAAKAPWSVSLVDQLLAVNLSVLLNILNLPTVSELCR